MQFVYILASRPHGALHVGLTSDLITRCEQLRSGKGSAHTTKYGIKTLVWFRRFEYLDEAVAFERRLKRWHRSWKDELIEAVNPAWEDMLLSVP